jgi:hypothetical protein
MALNSIKTFGYCQCFLSQNIFLRHLGLHVKYDNDQQFKEDYFKEVIGKSDFEQSLDLVKAEIHRRQNLRLNSIKRLETVQDKYKPLHPEVYKFDDLGQHVIERDIINQPDHKVGQDVFKIPVFKEDFCVKFLEEIRNFKTSGIDHEQPNSMNRHGVILDEIGFKEFFDEFRIQFIQPWARQVFNDPELILDSHKAFIVKVRFQPYMGKGGGGGCTCIFLFCQLLRVRFYLHCQLLRVSFC